MVGRNKTRAGGRQIRHGSCAHDGAVHRVALHRRAARGADEALELAARSELRGRRPGVVINFFFDDGAVNVVCAESQSDLRDARSQHHPIRLDVIEIIEQQARDGDGAQIVKAGRLGQDARGPYFPDETPVE